MCSATQWLQGNMIQFPATKQYLWNQPETLTLVNLSDWDAKLSLFAGYMKLLEKRANIVSNLIWSVPIDCKIMQFNFTPFNQILPIFSLQLSGGDDRDYLAHACYMEQIKKYTSVMSSLIL